MYRIYNSDTLECLGVSETVVTDNGLRGIHRKHHRVIYGLGAVIALLVVLVVYKEIQISTLQSEYDEIENVLALTERDATLEQLAGTYLLCGRTEIEDSDGIYEFIQTCGACYPDIIMAQCIIESGGGTSVLARDANNLFGMKRVTTRPTTQVGDVRGYGKYANWQSSVIDRCLWDAYVFKDGVPDREVYLNKIRAVYAEDRNYIAKIEKVIKQNNL